MNETSYIFGPVPSRRLGRSLGIDLVPHKTCSYDCTYCQLGRTTCKTAERREYIPTGEILRQLKRKIQAGVEADYITLSGSGEPTLHSGCAEIIRAAKRMTDTPVAVLTNGSLLWDPAVREGLCEADLVVPSLDAGDAETFMLVNRPHESIVFETMVEGLAGFSRLFPGELWLEVFLLAGSTGTTREVEKIAEHIRGIRTDRIHVNTVARPPAEPSAAAVPQDEIVRLAGILDEKAEVIADYRGVHREETFACAREDVLNMLKRRPCTLDDTASGLGIHRNEALKYLDHLVGDGEVRTEMRDGRTFYFVQRD